MNSICIEWKYLTSNWDYDRCLYAYLHPNTSDILYIGKAYKHSVRKRMKGNHKEELYKYIINSYNTNKLKVIVGELILYEGCRLSEELVTDIESLLIIRLKPPGNIQNRKSRNYMRPGTCVTCEGAWPHTRSRFIDK